MAFRASGVEDYKFAPPSQVAQSLWEGFGDGTILRGVGESMFRVILGYGVSLIIGVVLGLSLVSSRFVHWLIGPLILGVQSLPSICWMPLGILQFGLNEKAILFVVIMGSVGSISIALRDGLTQVPVTYQRVAGTFGASMTQRLMLVSIPAALPVFISGLKQGWSFAWRSLLAGELIRGSGMGGLLNRSRDESDYPRMFAVMILIVVISVLIDKVLFSRLEDRIRVRWGLAGR